MASRSLPRLVLAAPIGMTVVLTGVYLHYHVLDTYAHRKSIADEVQSLAKDVERNPADVAALNAIIEVSQGRFSFGRTYAIVALGELGPLAAPAVPALRESLRSNDRYNRREAARSLGKIGNGARSAATDLARLLMQEEDADYAQFAAESLGEIGSRDPYVIEQLERASVSANPTLRGNARRALAILKE